MYAAYMRACEERRVRINEMGAQYKRLIDDMYWTVIMMFVLDMFITFARHGYLKWYLTRILWYIAALVSLATVYYMGMVVIKIMVPGGIVYFIFMWQMLLLTWFILMHISVNQHVEELPPPPDISPPAPAA